MRDTGINHLALVTADMDATIRFWRDLLGMPMVVSLGHPGYRHYFFQISEYDMIAFFEWPGVEPVSEKDHGVPVRGPVAFDHVSIGLLGLGSHRPRVHPFGVRLRPQQHPHRVQLAGAGMRCAPPSCLD
jgi:catechol 2,3-dioxygenase-like lactoylglutathione lyase family enzyme